MLTQVLLSLSRSLALCISLFLINFPFSSRYIMHTRVLMRELLPHHPVVNLSIHRLLNADSPRRWLVPGGG
uniref:Putative secreted protein n=1 Tax=Anopheles darlingi TaxID=43151 RepID=A0A2M4DAX1_ANODA